MSDFHIGDRVRVKSDGPGTLVDRDSYNPWMWCIALDDPAEFQPRIISASPEYLERIDAGEVGGAEGTGRRAAGGLAGSPPVDPGGTGSADAETEAPEAPAAAAPAAPAGPAEVTIHFADGRVGRGIVVWHAD